MLALGSHAITLACPNPTSFRAIPLSFAQLSLEAVLQCGQSFRWSIFPLQIGVSSTDQDSNPNHEFRLCLRDRVVCLRQSPDTLFYRSVFPGKLAVGEAALDQDQREDETLTWIRDYFQLDVDLVDLYGQWAKRDPVFKQACSERFCGIRMLRQDPFENLISFICSSNNNITRISKMVKALCQHYSPALLSLPGPLGSEYSSQVETYHPFPSPSVLAASKVPAKLRTLGFGYRAEFIQKTARMLVEAHGTSRIITDALEPAERWLYTLRTTGTSEARKELLRFMGVGRKVADCILLMSLDKKEVIPVDTHVHQIAKKHYGITRSSKTRGAMNPKLYEEVSDKLTAVWGDYAGWAHSVLFTSDLKSFASYGLTTPTPTPSPSIQTEKVKRSHKTAAGTLTSPSPPSSPKQKRLRSALESTEAEIAVIAEEKDSILPIVDDGLNMADRVKRRRRV